MSQKALDELEKARDRLLNAQTRCSWCHAVCRSSDELVLHIWETHDPPKNPEFIQLIKDKIAGRL